MILQVCTNTWAMGAYFNTLFTQVSFVTNMKSFLPNWTKGKSDKSQRSQPRGYKPDMAEVSIADIDIITKLDKQGHIPDSAIKRLKSKGIVLPFEFDRADTAET